MRSLCLVCVRCCLQRRGMRGRWHGQAPHDWRARRAMFIDGAGGFVAIDVLGVRTELLAEVRWMRGRGLGGCEDGGAGGLVTVGIPGYVERCSLTTRAYVSLPVCPVCVGRCS